MKKDKGWSPFISDFQFLNRIALLKKCPCKICAEEIKETEKEYLKRCGDYSPKENLKSIDTI